MVKRINEHDGPDWRAAVEFGFDPSQMEYLLSLSPEQRLQRHERALLGILELRQMGCDYLGFDPRNPQPPDRA